MLAKFLSSSIRVADMPKSSKPQIAMVGRSNVGKSSLINHLAGAKSLARTSAKAGLTQTINVYDFDRFHLVDLPGYGFSRAQRSQGRGFEDMIGAYLSDAPNLKLVFLIIDSRLGFTDSDQELLEQLKEEAIPFVVIFNKVDKLSKSALASALRNLKIEHKDVRFIPHSFEGSLGELRDAIEIATRK